MNLSSGKPSKKRVLKKYLVGVLAFFGLLHILKEGFLWFWFYFTYGLPF